MPFFAPILILVAIAWRDAAAGPTMREWMGDGWAVGLSVLVLLWPVIAGWPAHIWAGRRMDRYGSTSAPIVSHRVLSLQGLLIACGGVCSIVLFGLLDSVRALLGNPVALDEVLTGIICCSPWIIALIQSHPIERRLWDATFARHLDQGLHRVRTMGCVSWVWTRIRESVLPIALPGTIMLAWWETVPILIRWAHARAPALGLIVDNPDTGPHLSIVGLGAMYAGVVALAILAPRLMARSLPTVRLRDGDLHDEVRRICAEARTRAPAVYLWLPTRGFANAAVLGAFPFRRALLITEALVASLPRDELRAVIAHEAGHMRRWHVFWLVATVMAFLLALDAAAVAWNLRPGSLPTLVGLLVVFAATSQWFERQADAIAASIVGDSRVVASALRRVAAVNGSRPARWSITHGSINDRTARLTRIPPPAPPKGTLFTIFRIVVAVILGASVTMLSLAIG